MKGKDVQRVQKTEKKQTEESAQVLLKAEEKLINQQGTSRQEIEIKNAVTENTLREFCDGWPS